MKKRKDLIKMITLNGMVATVYAVLTLMIQPLAYRELQLRLSEIVVLLAFYNIQMVNLIYKTIKNRRVMHNFCFFIFYRNLN